MKNTDGITVHDRPRGVAAAFRLRPTGPDSTNQTSPREGVVIDSLSVQRRPFVVSSPPGLIEILFSAPRQRGVDACPVRGVVHFLRWPLAGHPESDERSRPRSLPASRHSAQCLSIPQPISAVPIRLSSIPRRTLGIHRQRLRHSECSYRPVFVPFYLIPKNALRSPHLPFPRLDRAAPPGPGSAPASLAASNAESPRAPADSRLGRLPLCALRRSGRTATLLHILLQLRFPPQDVVIMLARSGGPHRGYIATTSSPALFRANRIGSLLACT